MSSTPAAPRFSTQSSTSSANESDSARSPDSSRSVHRPSPRSIRRLNVAPARTPCVAPPTAFASARASPSAFGCFRISSSFRLSTASPYTANRRRTSRRVTHGGFSFPSESSAKNVSRLRRKRASPSRGAEAGTDVADVAKPSSGHERRLVCSNRGSRFEQTTSLFSP